MFLKLGCRALRFRPMIRVEVVGIKIATAPIYILLVNQFSTILMLSRSLLSSTTRINSCFCCGGLIGCETTISLVNGVHGVAELRVIEKLRLFLIDTHWLISHCFWQLLTWFLKVAWSGEGTAWAFEKLIFMDRDLEVDGIRFDVLVCWVLLDVRRMTVRLHLTKFLFNI